MPCPWAPGNDVRQASASQEKIKEIPGCKFGKSLSATLALRSASKAFKICDHCRRDILMRHLDHLDEFTNMLVYIRLIRMCFACTFYFSLKLIWGSRVVQGRAKILCNPTWESTHKGPIKKLMKVEQRWSNGISFVMTQVTGVNAVSEKNLHRNFQWAITCVNIMAISNTVYMYDVLGDILCDYVIRQWYTNDTMIYEVPLYIMIYRSTHCICLVFLFRACKIRQLFVQTEPNCQRSPRWFYAPAEAYV